MLFYLNKSLETAEELGDNSEIGNCLYQYGFIHSSFGSFDKAIDFYNRSLDLYEKLGINRLIGFNHCEIGIAHYSRGNYEKAINHLKQAIVVKREVTKDTTTLIREITYYNLANKILGKKYDFNEINGLIKKTEKVGFEINYRIYQLIEDNSFLRTAYRQIQEKAEKFESHVAAKFLSYPIPKAIVEEWEKVK
jgi:tetratricopeptide (TPR) repeat protein